MIERFQEDLKRAMKAGDKLTVSVLRMLISELKYSAIDEKRDLGEAEVAALIQKSIRSRKESIEAFRTGGRPELAEKEEAELKILELYLPAQMQGPELEQAVDRLLSELNVTQKKDMGRAMKEFMSRYRGKADGKAVNALIASRLR
ncbi:MAG: GatB/YqeY domain-containing protein [Acidobacteria bacterium]|nr:GatB/YqeY domain-containing protein [Acidobacteriota bacterium]